MSEAISEAFAYAAPSAHRFAYPGTCGDDALMSVICPTGQIFIFRREDE